MLLYQIAVTTAVIAAAAAGLLTAPAVLAPGAPLAPHAFPLGFAAAAPLGGGSNLGGGKGPSSSPSSSSSSPSSPSSTGSGITAAVAKVTAIDADYDPNPQYSYAYDIQDALTGDAKDQQETRSGDVVQGSYSLVEPDGTRRTVEYTADPVNGFNAVVHREPAIGKPVVAGQAATKIAAPVAYAHPVAKVATPLTYSAGPYPPFHTKAIIG